MAKPIYGDLELKGQQTLRFADSDSSNVVSLGAPAAISSDLALVLPSSDTANGALVSNGSGTLSLALISNDNVDASAAIAQSKLDLSITDSEVDAAAAISLSKLASLTASRALTSDGSGVISVSATTSTELGYLSGVTSAIQTQIDGKASTDLSDLASVAINTSLISDTDNTDDLGSAAIGWANGYINSLHLDSNSQTTSLSGSASASASVSYTLPPAAPASNGYVLASQTDGTMSWVSNASSASFTQDWDTADGTSLAVSHSLGTKDVLVQVYDKANDQTIEVDSVVRTDANTVTLTSSEAPNASSWRVLVLALS